MQIGTFTKTEDGHFTGRIETLTFAVDVNFVPVTEKTKERAPDYRIIAVYTGAEIGVGWNETSQRTSKPYISVKIDDPSFAYPMWAALTANETEGYTLNWSRPKPKSGSYNDGQEETL